MLMIVGQGGQEPEKAAEDRLRDILSRLQKSGKPIQDGLLWSVRNHFKAIYPGSKHYDPDRVQPAEKRDGDAPEGSVDVDVPGVTRAYHDLTIRPRLRKALTIPMHREAYGKKAADFAGLFKVTKKDGSAFLAQRRAEGLVFLFALKDSVFQRRNPGLMPSDEALAANVFGRIEAYLASAK